MLRHGLKTIAMAAGLALAGVAAHAAAPQGAPQAVAAPTTSPATQAAAEPAGVSNVAPTTAAATPPAAPTSPLLAQDGAPETRVDPLVVCRSFQSLYCLGRIQAAFSLLDAALDSTPDLCQLLATTFPAIEQDPNFATRALNAPKNQ